MAIRLSKRNSHLLKIIAAFYVLVGTCDVAFWNMGVSNALDSWVENSDFFLLFPSHFLGTLFSYILGSILGYGKFFFWVGQLISYLVLYIIIQFCSSGNAVMCSTPHHKDSL